MNKVLNYGNICSFKHILHIHTVKIVNIKARSFYVVAKPVLGVNTKFTKNSGGLRDDLTCLKLV